MVHGRNLCPVVANVVSGTGTETLRGLMADNNVKPTLGFTSKHPRLGGVASRDQGGRLRPVTCMRAAMSVAAFVPSLRQAKVAP